MLILRMIKIISTLSLVIVFFLIISILPVKAQTTTDISPLISLQEIESINLKVNEISDNLENIQKDKNNYSEILEKTNQQLNLWTNPFSLMIGALGVLFTILTLVAAVITYRQNKDYKNKINKDREAYKEEIRLYFENQADIINERNEQVKEMGTQLNNLLNQYKKQLNKASSTQKKEIEKAIKNLEKEKVLLGTKTGPFTVYPQYSNSLASNFMQNEVMHKCSICGYGYRVKKDIASVGYGLAMTSCPKCGNTDSSYI